MLSVLIWVQTVCKGYQQMTKVAASKKRVNVKLKTLSFEMNDFTCLSILYGIGIFEQL